MLFSLLELKAHSSIFREDDLDFAFLRLRLLTDDDELTAVYDDDGALR